MPTLLVPIIAGAGLTGGISLFGGVTISFASIAAYGITGAAILGAGFLLNELNGPGNQKVDEKLNVKQAVPARVRGYGYCKLGGAFFALYASGTLVEGFIHCQGPIYQIHEWWLNDQVATGIVSGTLSGTSGVVPGKEKLLLDSQLGTADQVANPGLVVSIPDWGSTRRVRGLANTAMRCQLPSSPSKNYQKYYPGGVPALRVVAQTSLVYDPRISGQNPNDDPYAPATWQWSENSGLCIRDYLTHPDGLRIPQDLINDAFFAAFADLCDQLVLKADGTSELRYRVQQGTYDFTEKPADVLQRLLATCDGQLYQLADGTIGIRGGQWVAPTVTVDDSMVLTYTATQGNGFLTAFNQYRIRYVDTRLDYQQVEGDPWDDLAAQALSGEIVPQDFDAAMSPYQQARRLAKIAMHKANPQYIFELNCTMAALDAYGEEIVNFTLDDIGFSGTVYISKFEINDDLSGCTMTVSSLGPEAYQWDVSQEGKPAPKPDTSTATLVIPDVMDLTVEAVRTTLSGDVNAIQIEASVTAPSDDSFSLHAQYRAHGATDWIDMSPLGAWSALSGIVADGGTYDVQAAFESFGGTDGTFVATTITVHADTAAPAGPSDASATPLGGGVTLQWTDPASSNFSNMLIKRAIGAASVMGDATDLGAIYGAPNQTLTYADTGLTAATYRYWLVARNPSGIGADPVGPLDAVVS